MPACLQCGREMTSTMLRLQGVGHGQVLGGHPEPANDGHLKTGQRGRGSRRYGSGLLPPSAPATSPTSSLHFTRISPPGSAAIRAFTYFGPKSVVPSLAGTICLPWLTDPRARRSFDPSDRAGDLEADSRPRGPLGSAEGLARASHLRVRYQLLDGAGSWSEGRSFGHATCD